MRVRGRPDAPHQQSRFRNHLQGLARSVSDSRLDGMGHWHQRSHSDEKDKAKYIHKLEFWSKEGTAPAIYAQIREGDQSTVRIERVERPSEPQRKAKRVCDLPAIGVGNERGTDIGRKLNFSFASHRMAGPAFS
jgi:hypothetical protein